MITILPSVQRSIKRAARYVRWGTRRWDKRNANRRYRRTLNRVTRGFCHDPELFYSEDFGTPSLSGRDIW
jgi:hypothetical protein